jgi:hypothetical protein
LQLKRSPILWGHSCEKGKVYIIPEARMEVLQEFMTQPNRKFTAAELIPGRFYTVVMAFTDYDGLVHDVGETWKFARKNFLPYEDGLTLHIEKAGTPTMIRMQWTDEAQGPIIDEFFVYVNELPEG